MTSSSEIEAQQFYSVPPGLETHLRLRTLPNATCVIRAEHESSPSFVAYADGSGFLDLHVRPFGQSDDIHRFMIEASANGETIRQIVGIRPSVQPTDQAPRPATVRRWEPPTDARTRPPLSLEESLRLSDEELIAQG